MVIPGVDVRNVSDVKIGIYDENGDILGDGLDPFFMKVVHLLQVLKGDNLDNQRFGLTPEYIQCDFVDIFTRNIATFRGERKIVCTCLLNDYYSNISTLR